MRHLSIVIVALAPACAIAQDASGVLVKRTSGAGAEDSIDGYLVGFAPASISAASLAKVGGDAVTTVENVRDFAIAFKGDTPLAKKVFGLSITPARSSFGFPKLSFSEYAGAKRADGSRENNWGNRLLGSLTLSYAQGNSTTAGVDFQRRALAVETSLYFDPADDPVVAFAKAECMTKAFDATKPAAPQATGAGDPVLVRRDASVTAKAYKACVDEEQGKLEEKWNRSRASVSFGTGWIRRADGSGEQQGLGRSLGMGLIWGFDGPVRMPDSLRERAALSVVARRSVGEPVLDSLVNGPLRTRATTLVATRFALGSGSFRGLVEFSNSDSRDITTSQAVFRRAIGVDYRVTDGLWINLRSGKQRKIDGSGEENASFLALSYSPKPDLKLAM